MVSFSSKEQCKPNFDSTGWVLFLLITVDSLLLLNEYHIIFLIIWIILICLLNYLRRNTPNFQDRCKITLNDKTFTYKDFISDYIVTIEYTKVIEVTSFQERGITFVRINMENNFELICVNLNDIENFLSLIRTKTATIGGKPYI